MRIGTNRVDLDAEGLDLEVLALEDLSAIEGQLARARAYLRGLPPAARRTIGKQIRILERELGFQLGSLALRTVGP